MIASSRPLRFVALVMLGWTAMRTVQLWPVAPPPPPLIPALLEALVPPAEASPTRATTRPAPTGFSFVAKETGRPLTRPAMTATLIGTEAIADSHGTVQNARAYFLPTAVPSLQSFPPIGSPLPMPSTAPDPIGSVPPRLRGSAWAIVRGGGSASPFAPQLGGSQASMRLTYAIDEARRFAVAGRLSSALGQRQREAAIGVDWQPTALPIHLIAEQRIGIDGARGGPSIGVIAGIGPTPAAAGFRVDAYGQAGGIARGGTVEGYADGALRIARPIATIGSATIDLGLGGWGGVQRSATRFDVGPTASAALPVAGKAVRVSVDWRRRVAGNARPRSGPAVSIGTDF